MTMTQPSLPTKREALQQAAIYVKLDTVCEQVINYFASQVASMTNSEAEYVLEHLAIRFDDLLERIKEGDTR